MPSTARNAPRGAAWQPTAARADPFPTAVTGISPMTPARKRSGARPGVPERPR